MTTYLVPLMLIGGLTSAGVYLLLERNLTRMLLGLLLIGNAINLLILTVGGPSGNPPIHGRTSNGETTTADPLAQGMILTAIVITHGYRGVRAGADLPLVPVDHRRGSQRRPRGHPGLAADRPRTRPRSMRTVRTRTGPRHRPARRARRAAGTGGLAMTRPPRRC